MKKIITLFTVAFLCFSLCSCSVSELRKPEIWAGGFNMLQISEVGLEGCQNTFSKITGVNLFKSLIDNNTPETLEKLAKILKENNIKVSIEVGGLYNHEWGNSCGEISANDVDLKTFDKWAEAGGTVDKIFMDEAIGRVCSKDGAGWGSPDFKYLSYEEAGGEMADYIELVRAKYPSVQIYLGTNFPNWGWKGGSDFYKRGDDGMYRGDYYVAMTAFLDAVLLRGAVIDGVEADNPYSYYMGYDTKDKSVNWAERLSDLEAEVKARGLKFCLIVNSEEGMKSNKYFSKQTLRYIELYLQRGTKADSFVVESWYDYPDIVAPETTQYSLFELTSKVFDYAFDFYNKTTEE